MNKNWTPSEEGLIDYFVDQVNLFGFDSFACDWVEPGTSHDVNASSCADRLVSHVKAALPSIPEDLVGEVCRRVVDGWGNLEIEPEVDEPESDPEVVPTQNPSAAWPFPTPGRR